MKVFGWTILVIIVCSLVFMAYSIFTLEERYQIIVFQHNKDAKEFITKLEDYRDKDWFIGVNVLNTDVFDEDTPSKDTQGYMEMYQIEHTPAVVIEGYKGVKMGSTKLKTYDLIEAINYLEKKN